MYKKLPYLRSWMGVMIVVVIMVVMVHRSHFSNPHITTFFNKILTFWRNEKIKTRMMIDTCYAEFYWTRFIFRYMINSFSQSLNICFKKDDNQLSICISMCYIDDKFLKRHFKRFFTLFTTCQIGTNDQ